MHKDLLSACGLFFIISITPQFVFAESADSLDLERIVIAKDKAHFLNYYQFDRDQINFLPFDSPVESLSLLSLDLQNRSPKSAIQTDFSLRGSNFQGVLILLDGTKINDPQTGHHNSDIPLTKADVEKIEVIPGADASLFGPDAMGGAVNFFVRKPQEKERIFEFGGGQYKTFGGLFSLSEKKDNLGVRFSVENRESAGFRYDTDFKKFTSTLAASLDSPPGGLDLSFGYQEKEFGAFDFYTPGSGFASKEWTKTYLLKAGGDFQNFGLRIKPDFLWRRHFDKFLLDKTLIRTRYLNHHQSDIYTPSIYMQGDLPDFTKLGLGFEYGQERINSTNLGKHLRSHESLFMDGSRDFSGGLSLGASGRLDNYDSFGAFLTGSLNTKYHLTEQGALNFSVKRTARVPSFTELYYNDPTTVGNPDLSAEEALGYDLGYLYQEEGLKTGLTIFYRGEEDMIDWVKRDSSQAKFQVENITRDFVAGSEASLKVKLRRDLDLEANYTLIFKHLFGRGYIYKYGLNYPKHQFNCLLKADLPFGTQSITFSYKKKPGRRGWVLCNTHFSYNILESSNLFLNITNFFNVEYQEIEGISQPGRWIEAGFRLDW